jgi:hypothetical protein
MELGDPFALIDVLVRHYVSMVIIGDYAVIYHGYSSDDAGNAIRLLGYLRFRAGLSPRGRS